MGHSSSGAVEVAAPVPNTTRESVSLPISLFLPIVRHVGAYLLQLSDASRLVAEGLVFHKQLGYHLQTVLFSDHWEVVSDQTNGKFGATQVAAVLS